MVSHLTTTKSFIRKTFRILGIVRWANAAFLEAAAAYERRARVDALRRWNILAADGDDSARFMIRLIGSDALYFALPDLARGWLYDAAERGVAAVQQLVGSMYCGGIGVPQDVVTGLNWYRKAADQGYPQAQEHLGWLYLEGLSVAQDHEQAGRWLLLAATQGSIFSCLALGVAYCGGWGVPRNDSEAEKWYRKAADQEVVGEQGAHGLYYAAQPVAGPAPRDDSEAVVRYAADADQGLDMAQFKLALRYLTGRGMPQSDSDAAHWFRRAAEQGLERAQYRVGFLHALGVGVPRDHVAAHMWLNLAAASSSDRSIASAARDAVAARMSIEQIGQAHRLAREWRQDRRPTMNWHMRQISPEQRNPTLE